MLRRLVGALDEQIAQSSSQARSESSQTGNQTISTSSTANTTAINEHRRLFSRQSVSMVNCKMNNFNFFELSCSRRKKDGNIHTVGAI